MPRASVGEPLHDRPEPTRHSTRSGDAPGSSGGHLQKQAVLDVGSVTCYGRMAIGLGLVPVAAVPSALSTPVAPSMANVVTLFAFKFAT